MKDDKRMRSIIKYHKFFVILFSFLIIMCFLDILIKPKDINSTRYKETIDYDYRQNLKKSKFWNLTGSPINIYNDAGWLAAKAEGWCTGSGQENDPYLIENVTIDGLNSSGCISIWQTGRYFIIKNCTLYNSGDSWTNAGIYIGQGADNGKLIENNCSFNNGHGIFIYQANGVIVLGNKANNNSKDGIFNLNSFYLNISNNKANNNKGNGILIDSICCGPEGIISNNTVEKNELNGIYADHVYNHTYTNNTVISNKKNGIKLESSSHSLIGNNSVENNTNYGIALIRSSYNTIKDNKLKNNKHCIYEYKSSNNVYENNGDCNVLRDSGTNGIVDGSSTGDSDDDSGNGIISIGYVFLLILIISIISSIFLIKRKGFHLN